MQQSGGLRRWAFNVTVKYTSHELTAEVETQCSLLPQLCPTVTSGERERVQGRKKGRRSGSHCHHAGLLFTLLRMQPSAPRLFHLHFVARELQLRGPFFFLYMRLNEGEEGNGDRVVMRWTSSHKASRAPRHLNSK